MFPPTRSFAPLATLHLPTSQILHPDACNPAMDLVVLLAPSDAPLTAKGKEKETSGRTSVILWRMSGSKVWEVELQGDVEGLAWSLDGLYLSLLLVDYPALPSTFLKTGERWRARTATLEHLSVHTGSTVRSVAKVPTNHGVQHGGWWRMSWESGGEWGRSKCGSAAMIIDSLPRVTPIPPVLPANALPFNLLIPQAASASHPSLDTFPSLLPDVPPDILVISPPGGSSAHRYLTGTFPVPATSPLLSLGQIANQMCRFLDVVLRGLDAAEDALREGDKQTMIWREELEICADQQGVSKDDVHADLFKFMMTGRSGPAVTEWLGNRLTGRTITKWEAALDSSFMALQRLICESITPALERIILLLEELRGWAKSPILDLAAVARANELACRLATAMERMRQDAEHEMHAAGEWMKWLKYEIARAAAQEPSQDNLPTAMHDLKLAWSFMQNGFVASPFHKFFQKLPQDKTPNTLPQRSARELDDVLNESLRNLSVNPRHVLPVSQEEDERSVNCSLVSPLQAGDQSVDSILPASPSATPTREYRAWSADDSGTHDPITRVEEHIVNRSIENELWVWMKALVTQCETLVTQALPGRPVPLTMLKLLDPEGSLCTERSTANGRWLAIIPPTRSDSPILWLVHFPPEQNSTGTMAAFSLQGAVLASQFFDDHELVLLFESQDKQRYLTTTRYTTLQDEMAPFPSRDVGVLEHLNHEPGRKTTVLPLSRCRQLNSLASTQLAQEKVTLALNGRKGRRVGCIIMGEGRSVEILDMDEDEDETVDEEEEEMEGVEDG